MSGGTKVDEVLLPSGITPRRGDDFGTYLKVTNLD
jgi:hypothetical protein